MPKRVTFHRAAIVLLLTVFALPSCFTTALWQEQHEVVHREPVTVAVAQTCVTTDGGAVTGFAVQLGADAGPLGSDAANGWLAIDSLAAPQAVVTFVDALRRGQLHEPRLAVVLGTASDGATVPGAALLQLRARLLRAAPIGIPGLDFDGENCRVTCACHVRLEPPSPAAIQPWPGPPAEFGREWDAEPTERVVGKVLLTPIAVAADVVTLPVQALLTVLFWLAD